MLRPTNLHPELALELLDISSRAWPHGADAMFAMADTLRRYGVPLDRMEVGLSVAHPLITRVRALWAPSTGGSWMVEMNQTRIEETAEERVAAASPLRSGAISNRTGLLDAMPEEIAAHVQDVAIPLDAPLRIDLPGFTDTLVCGIDYGAPKRSIYIFATREPSGFDDAAARAIHTAVWGITPVARLMRWRALAQIIASTYLGPSTGMRVISGELRLGEVERRHAVVWFSDLRGFTAMSANMAPEAVVRRINEVFEHVGAAIHDEGGEILKFIGDAILAIFPYATEAEAATATQKALRAAKLCQARLPKGTAVGVGLHRGELAYGNVGAPDRLDFTVIGRTVNIASRIEGLTGKLGVGILASAEVAACDPSAWTSVGDFELKGIPEAISIHSAR
jgi:adenylate cyclase